MGEIVVCVVERFRENKEMKSTLIIIKEQDTKHCGRKIEQAVDSNAVWVN